MIQWFCVDLLEMGYTQRLAHSLIREREREQLLSVFIDDQRKGRAHGKDPCVDYHEPNT